MNLYHKFRLALKRYFIRNREVAPDVSMFPKHNVLRYYPLRAAASPSRPKSPSKRNFFKSISRAAILAGAATTLSSIPAWADTLFTSFSFLATDRPTARTDPDRWADVFNVKDFGVVGNGSTDDHVAFQLCIDTALTTPGGTVFIPKFMNIYLGTSAANKIVFTACLTGAHISIVGDCSENETEGASITGNFADYLIDTLTTGGQGIRRIQGVNIHNFHASGSGLKLNNAVCAEIADCTISAGVVGIRAGCDNPVDPGYISTFDTAVRNCIIKGPLSAAGSIGLILSQGIAQNCRFTNWDEGLRAYNIGVAIVGNSFESNNTGLVLGVNDIGGNSQLSGGLVSANSFELNAVVGIYAKNFSGQIVGNGVTSNNMVTQPPYGMRLTNVTASLISGTVSGYYSTFAILFDGNCVNTVCLGLETNNVGSGGQWSLPTGSNAIGLVCDPVSNNCPVLVHTVAAVTGISAPVEGMEYNVSDGTNGLGWGVTVTGTGTTHYKVRYNGSAWTVVGK